ncbi:flagellar hook-length control protein FliK [Sporosarcina limicola]|uniref:Flagellar hook-length control protein FliK n=1 Tax=Sporosarcina limicola TaxID=34101 RepID=A0A927MF65_9BACL|nr:flagellar hook-length control protein FliK [Sporosarcina limicola]MBE1553460.1 flagellar hook-length control protein FliK [Sporosarcina limicola]
MNFASIRATSEVNPQPSQNGVKAYEASDGTFGSVFNSIITKSGTAIIAPIQQNPQKEVSNKLISELLNTSSTEQIEDILKQLLGEEELDSISGIEFISFLGNFEELANLLKMEPEKLIDNLNILLGKEVFSEDVNLNDVWTVLEQIDKVAPQFSNRLTESLEGKGEVSKQSAIELLALLKVVELVAPKTDLLMKQEQQVFSLQSLLATVGEQFGDAIKINISVKSGMHHLMESHQVMKFAVQTEAGQTTNSELSQQAMNNVTGNVVVSKGEVTLAELENRNNLRNEELVREMQNIFKRSNFGQTGGTNRLLIKLYPEHLGQVRIELLQVNGIMTARILASTALGKEMLESQLHQLKNAFMQQNLQVERIDVSQTLQDTSRNDRDQAFSQFFKKEEQETADDQGQNDEMEITFQEYMIELEA